MDEQATSASATDTTSTPTPSDPLSGVVSYFPKPFSTTHNQRAITARRVLHEHRVELAGNPHAQIRHWAVEKDNHEAHEARRMSAKAAHTRIKRTLPAVTWSAAFPGARRKEAPLTPSGLLAIDYDHLDDPAQWRDRLSNVPIVAAAFISPSADGVKAIIALTAPFPQTNDEHHRAWQTAVGYVKTLHPDAPAADTNAKDITRLSFRSLDPDLYIAPADEIVTLAWNIAQPTSEPAPPAANDQIEKHEVPPAERRERAHIADVEAYGSRNAAYLPPQLAELATMGEGGGRHALITRIAYAAGGHTGYTLEQATNARDAILDAARASGYHQKVGEDDIVRAIGDAWKAGSESPQPQQQPRPQRPRLVDESPLNESSQNGGEPNPLNDLRQDAQSLAACLAALGWKCRFNVRASAPEWLYHGNSEWVKADDYAEAALREEIARRFSTYSANLKKQIRLVFGDTSWNRCLKALLHERRVDPFIEWLEELPQWDATSRLDTVLTDLFNAPNTELTKWAGRHTLLLAIERAFYPGAYGSEIPILLGPQGIGKDTYYRFLFPARHRSQFFSDMLTFDADPGRQAEAMLGRVIVVASEMPGLSRREIEHVKAFVSRQHDNYRLAYHRYVNELPRRVAIAGTANPPLALPNDLSGERRFVPIELWPTATQEEIDTNSAHVRRYMDHNRDQLWAEALHLHRTRRGSRLPDALKAAQREQSGQYRAVDELIENAVAHALESLLREPWVPEDDAPDVGEFTLGQLIAKSPKDGDGKPVLTSARDTRIAKALGRLECVRLSGPGSKRNVQIDGVRHRAHLWRHVPSHEAYHDD